MARPGVGVLRTFPVIPVVPFQPPPHLRFADRTLQQGADADLSPLLTFRGGISVRTFGVGRQASRSTLLGGFRADLGEYGRQGHVDRHLDVGRAQALSVLP